MNRLIVLALPALLASCTPENGKFNGYVEGDFVRVAPTSAGILGNLFVERGQQVTPGQPLFALDLTNLTAARDGAAATLAQAQSNLGNLTKGKRPDEIDAIKNQIAQAKADLVDAQKQWKRTADLAKKDFAAKSLLDNAVAARDGATARVAELEANLKTAQLGARDDEIAAAQQAVDIAAQKLKQAEKLLAEAAPVAPKAASVEDTYFRPGEAVAANTPVVSLLPPENVKVRFFVPQKKLPALRLGEAVAITCDGCDKPVPGKISFIAKEAEYTPPVIYSVESRDKLVFMVEARPDAPDERLRPGLPVDIRPVPHD